uniref:Uncharacterized protein n=1 Tax=Bubo bubo TaxID=30461 RepID=A0A8C0FKN9_BUBBB
GLLQAGPCGCDALTRARGNLKNPPASTALNESDVLQKMAEEAAKKTPNAKPIKDGKFKPEVEE